MKFSLNFRLYVLILTLFVFQGCSSKEATLTPQNEQTVSTIESQKALKECVTCEEDTSDFDEEFGSEEEEIIDPLSGYNRFMTSFNDKVVLYALNPVSEAYGYIIPEPLRIGVANFIHNINFPIRFVNNLLQGKFQNTSDELERFLVNSTIGLAGLMDPAKHYMHIPAHNEDFGQTLGYYGVDTGFHIVLPFFGPSNVRDLVGITVDAYASPLINVRGLENYKIPDNFAQSVGITTFYFVNKNSLHLGEYESIKKDAIDLYPFLRDIYEQNRISEIEK